MRTVAITTSAVLGLRAEAARLVKTASCAIGSRKMKSIKRILAASTKTVVGVCKDPEAILALPVREADLVSRTASLSALALTAAMSMASSAALATPITQAFPFGIRDNESTNTIGTGIGETFSLGVSLVQPDGTEGTTASATNTVTGRFEPLLNLANQGRPGLFAREWDLVTAQSQNFLAPWQVTIVNGSDQLTVTTPDRRSAQRMEFVGNIAISGPSTAPTVTWNLPTSGPTVSRVRYELWNDDTNQILTGQSPVTLGPGATSVALEDLTAGVNYAIRIIPEELDAVGTVTRSSNWISWQAVDGAPVGNVVQLTTASPANLTQTVDVPATAFNLVFDYRFLTTTGALSVFLDGMPIGTVLEAPVNPPSDFFRAFFEIDNMSLLGATGVPLTFMLDGPAGSSLLLDNISFPGLVNGGFESLANWSTSGSGTVTLASLPEPAPLALFGFGLAGLGWAASRARRRKTH